MSVPANDLQIEARRVPQALVLELLNGAVWAPNHGMREPWRFIYIDHNNSLNMTFLHEQAQAHLIVVMKDDNDAHKRDEDLAAVYCLIQNFVLLAWEKKLLTKVYTPEWIYNNELSNRIGIQAKERIAAVMDFGFFLEEKKALLDDNVSLNFSLLK